MRAHRLFDKNKKGTTQKETEVDCFTSVSFLLFQSKYIFESSLFKGVFHPLLNACAMLKGRYRSTTLHYS